MTVPTLTQKAAGSSVLNHSTTPSASAGGLTNAANPALHHLTESSSLLLDIVRFSAAIVVLIGHVTVPDFRTAFPDLHVIGEYAVPVFFVLSGFVIRFVTRSREHTLRDFYIDRAARMYSVILPAMALTLVLAGVCILIDRPYYMRFWGAFSDHVVLRVFSNLTFISQSWGHTVIPLIDGPFWSLSYECLYYTAYGLIFYLKSWKRAPALLLWAIVAGPQVLFLLPVWWLGCWVYDFYHFVRNRPVARVLRGVTLVYILLAVALFALGRGVLLSLPFHLDTRFGQIPHPYTLLHIPVVRAGMLTAGTGILSAFLMLLALLLSDMIILPKRNIWTRRFRHLADGTFSIYLGHYPLLVLAGTIGLLRPHHLWLNISTGTGIGVILILMAAPLDIFKINIRTWLRRRFPSRRTSPLTAEAGA